MSEYPKTTKGIQYWVNGTTLNYATQTKLSPIQARIEEHLGGWRVFVIDDFDVMPTLKAFVDGWHVEKRSYSSQTDAIDAALAEFDKAECVAANKRRRDNHLRSYGREHYDMVWRGHRDIYFDAGKSK